MEKKVAIFGTSDVMDVEWGFGQILSSTVSEKLTKALEEGFEVYILTTRKNLYSHDDCWRSLISEDHILIPEKGGEIGSGNGTVIVLWEKLFNDLDLTPPDNIKFKRDNWLHWKWCAKDQGVRI